MASSIDGGMEVILTPNEIASLLHGEPFNKLKKGDNNLRAVQMVLSYYLLLSDFPATPRRFL